MFLILCSVTGVRKLSFFSGVDWDRLLEVEPPFVPQPDDDADTTYFEGKELFISDDFTPTLSRM